MTPTHPESEPVALLELSAIADEMRSRKFGHAKRRSPTLVKWADRIDDAIEATRAAALPQGDQDAVDARRYRDLVGWYDSLKLSRAETMCDLLGLPEADAINAGFDDLVDAYAENRDAATTPPPAELGEGGE